MDPGLTDTMSRFFGILPAVESVSTVFYDPFIDPHPGGPYNGTINSDAERENTMVRIVSDTSTLYSSAQAEAAGFHVSPLSVTIDGKTYREFDEITAEAFVAVIRRGHMPTSSQPAIGEVAELYDRFPGDEILNIAMAAGLSGTCQSAQAAADLCAHPENVTVINSRTLCGPHRYLVELAAGLARAGHTLQQIRETVEEKMDTAKSYLVPADLDYLRRGGRLSPLVSHVGQAVNLTPVMTQTDDGTRLTIAGIRRGYAHAVKYIVKALEKAGVGAGWRVYISHADAPDKAEQALSALKAAMPEAHCEIHPLSPAFITQGGPGCVAVQYIQA